MLACLGSCQGNQDCRPAYFCAPLDQGGGVCLPRCNADSECSQGYRCDGLSGQCVLQQGGPPVGVRVEQRALPTLQLSEQTAQSLTVDVPQGAISLMLALSTDANSFAVVQQITDPSGRILFRLGDTRSAMRIEVLGKGGQSVMIPNSPNVSLQAGTYTFHIVGTEQAQAQATALIKFADATASTGTIDLNLYFVGTPGLTASTAEKDQAFQSILANARARWLKLGITIGQIRAFDVQEPLASELSIIHYSKLGNLFSLSQGQTNKALNMFFVREVQGDQAGFTVFGVAGGLPGPAFLHGTRQSGVVVSTEGYQQAIERVGMTFAHEGGHYLGLYHTSERTGTSHDPLYDTPQCTAALDKNADGIVNGEECLQAGANNLMFWTVAPITQDHVTPNQRFVVMMNPLIK